MKKISLVLILSLICLFILSGCSKEVSSRDEANRVLLSVSSRIAECELTLQDYEKDIKTLSREKLEKLLTDMDEFHSDIVSCDSYKEVEDVAPKYDNAVKYYEKLIKHYEVVDKKLAKLEKENKRGK